MTDQVCRHCQHWTAPERESESEMTIGTCKAGPPTPFLTIRPEQNAFTQKVGMIQEVHSAWPPVAAHESCGGWSERRQ